MGPAAVKEKRRHFTPRTAQTKHSGRRENHSFAEESLAIWQEQSQEWNPEQSRLRPDLLQPMQTAVGGVIRSYFSRSLEGRQGSKYDPRSYSPALWLNTKYGS